MFRRAFAPVSLLLLAAGCRPVRTTHQFELSYPRERSDFAARFLGLPSGGTAVWISTADDGEPNGRYEGYQVVVDPGSPGDVEGALLPFLAAKGLRPGQPLAYILLTSADAQELAGAERLARDYPSGQIVVPPRSHRAGPRRLGGSIPEYLSLGPEITARALSLGDDLGPFQSFLVRFVDVQLLFLPSLPEDRREPYLERVAKELSSGGIHSTLVSSPSGIPRTMASLFGAEAVVGPGDPQPDPVLSFPPPSPGLSLEATTNGSEMSLPALRRSRFGHWIDCRGATDERPCGSELLSVTAEGPFLVSLPIGGAAVPFLVDTRAPFSYLSRARYQAIPGAETARTEPDEHGGEPLGLRVPSFPLGEGPSAPVIRGWRVLPIDPFTVAGKEVGGVLGMDLLQSFKITLLSAPRRLSLVPNFAAERTSLTPAETRTDLGSPAWDVPMDRSPAGPLILSTMDGRQVSLIVDLASPSSLVYLPPEEWARKVDRAKARPADYWSLILREGELSEAAWTRQELNVAELPVEDLNLFGAHFTGARVEAVDRPLDADVLGMDFLQGFKSVSLDFRRRSILLSR